MSRISLLNGAAMLAALALSVVAVGRGSARPGPPSAPGVASEPPARIASASTVADRLLFDLCPPDRVVAITALSAAGPQAHRFRGRATLRSLDDVEEIVRLRPEVLFVANVGDPRRVARVREAGIEVVEMTASDGVASLLADIRTVARVCGVPDGGERYARAFEGRMGRVAADVPTGARREALYLSVYGDRFFGGTVGSSYHDVLSAAGLEDAAAGRFEGWPQYAVEQILSLDPEIVVTRAGMRAMICGHEALARLQACRRGEVVEVEGDLLDDPGPAMLDAAEAVHEAVYD